MTDNKRCKEFNEKHEKILINYYQATGSNICLYDRAYKPVFLEDSKEFCPETMICPYCKNSNGIKKGEFPCHEMHVEAIKEANRKGDFHIYECPLGLLFWSSPIYTYGEFSGALRGAGFLSKNHKKTVDFFSIANDTCVMCNSEVSEEKFKERIESLPKASEERSQSLAEVMQVCAESLSSGNKDYHEIIRRMTQQQEEIARLMEKLRVQYGEKPGNPGYPLERERLLLAALRKGDIGEAKKELNEILAILLFFNPGQLKNVQLRAIELVVLISRIEINPIKIGTISMEINSHNLRMVQEAKTAEELISILHQVVDRVADNISSFRGVPHAAALRKAEHFIMENFTRKISLKEIADVAGLSPPYFSTIFKEEMGENLSKYLNRQRVEKASHLLLETDMSLVEIASACCFEDQSWFSKIFKTYAGISPGK
ncbi:MAG: PocR ligand-binding domain-containing protein, partial [Treponema sp.]|nr:PocR ligand-binding domain-containing protein [Treponema sp.]